MPGENFDDAFATLLKEENAANAAGTTGIKQPDVQNTPAAPKPAENAPAAPTPGQAAQAAQTDPESAPATPEAEASADEPVSEIEGVEGEGGEGGGAGGEPSPPAEAKNATDEALARLADMLAQRQTQQPTQRETPPAAPAPFSPEEIQFLNQYQTDFPDVARAEATIRRAEYQQLTQHIYREVANYFAPKLALLEQLADSAAYQQIVQRVPTYDAMRDQVAEWVKTQPAYLQVGMNHVIDQGTAEEIADLFGRFQQATGTTSPNPGGAGIAPSPAQGGRQAPPTPAVKPAAELSPTAKQAAARLAPVTGKRSAPTQAAPLTFEDAFDSFAKAG